MREMVAEPVTPVFGTIKIWYVPVVASVLPTRVKVAPQQVLDASVVPSGLSRYSEKLPLSPVPSTLTICPAVPLKLYPIKEAELIVVVTGVLKLMALFVVWLFSESATVPVTPLLGTATIWYVPFAARVLPMMLNWLVPLAEASAVPSGFNR